MHVLDVSAEVLDRLFRRFARVAEGVLQIPKRREVVAGIGVEYFAEPVGVGEYPYSLYQQRDACLLRERQRRVYDRFHRGALIFVARPCVFRANAHVGYTEVFRRLYIFLYLGAVLFEERCVRYVVPRIDARYRKPCLRHLAVRRVRHRWVEDARLFGELRLVDVVYLYPRKAAVLGDPAEVLPCIIVPPEGGK